ncbi:hypothetical protein DY000_02057716 [Brassica cretica]|uniref:SET domain-containing protein n=1 Tax=Brassica cretica TaxID=69181 RepID=A0ABQ7AHX9_BRACR|nr:hypothetical protein DY000_02057716 [Brassica cretica]
MTASVTVATGFLRSPSVSKSQNTSFLFTRQRISPKKSSVRPISASTSELPENVRSFWKWLGDQGVVSAKSAAEPAVVPEGLGLVARRDIGRNEVVLEIPKRLWISPETSAASKIGALCGGLKPWVSVALFLIREKYDEDSAWRVYLDVLPESTDSTIFWSEEELAELKGSIFLPISLLISLCIFWLATGFLRSPSVSKSQNTSFLFTRQRISPKKSSVRPISASTSELPENVRSFWKWLGDQGVVSAKSAAEPAVVPEGLGLVARRDIGRNEVVLEIPKRLWISPETSAASKIGALCGGLKPWVSVALFLIREKYDEDSAWRVYLDVLPESTDSTIFWSEEELAELKGTQLLSNTLGAKEYLENEFSKLEQEILKPNKDMFPSGITLDDFMWAFGILRSRAFSRLRGQDLVLIPLADLINHNPEIKTEDYAYEIKGAGLFSRDLLFSLKSPVYVKAGGQVYIQYDVNKSNAELALDYGFVESNPNRNSYTLTIEIPESDPFFGDKLDIAETNGMAETGYFDIVEGQSLPAGMLQYIRLVALGGSDAFLLESIFNNTIWGHLELPVSRSNEELICRVVRDACKSALSGFATTIEEDEKLLEEGKLDPRMELAIKVRIGEKKVLQQIDQIFKDRELELDLLEYYQERRLKDLGLVGEQGEIIFWE